MVTKARILSDGLVNWDSAGTAFVVTGADVDYAINLLQAGTLKVLDGTARWYPHSNIEINKIILRLGTAADATVGVRINKNGTSVKTGQLTAGQTSVELSAPFFTMLSTDYLTIDTTAIGINSPGADLYVQFVYKKV